jgi:hypothetical protein
MDVINRLFALPRRAPALTFAVALSLAAFGPALWTTVMAAPAREEVATDRVAGSTALPARPALVSASGTVTSIGNGVLGVVQSGQDDPVGFMLGGDSTVVRAGAPAAGVDLRPGDSVQLIVDGRTGRILLARAEPAAVGLPAPNGLVALLAATGWLAGAATLLRQSRVVRRVRPINAISRIPLPRLVGPRPLLSPRPGLVPGQVQTTPRTV